MSETQVETITVTVTATITGTKRDRLMASAEIYGHLDTLTHNVGENVTISYSDTPPAPVRKPRGPNKARTTDTGPALVHSGAGRPRKAAEQKIETAAA